METQYVLVLMLAFAGARASTAANIQQCPSAESSGQLGQGACPECPLKNVSIHVQNVLHPPYMDMTATVCNTPQKYLIGVMEQAADQNKTFRFSATFLNRELGWYVDAYNSVYANYSLDQSYWSILDGNMKPLNLGVSSYIPSNGETVTFNLTIYQRFNL